SMPSGVSSIFRNGAAACKTANCATADAEIVSRRAPTRVTCGAISLSSSSHFPLMLYSEFVKPVALRPGRVRLSAKPPTMASDPREHDRHGACRPQHILGRATDDEDDVGRERGQFRRMLTHALVIACAISILDRYVVSDLPTQLLQRLLERGVASHHFRIVRGQRCERRDAPHALRLLRARREWPCGRHAAEQGDEIAPSYT